MDDDPYPLSTIVDRARGYLHQAGLFDSEEFPAIEDDVTELAREIIGDVESSLGMSCSRPAPGPLPARSRPGRTEWPRGAAPARYRGGTRPFAPRRPR
ncbi:hypothetical protein [Streptomyces microflavus]|uniref:hypothetical protein n=1 Tax=Streptomyces microflavus TaxID=1919 RepID=UPI0033DB5486|nr:hypothetical protein OG269_01550 [Streptomyces microflavus]WST19250.1 hypothetical protein OG721_37195 [Streptomyces microflavus]